MDHRGKLGAMVDRQLIERSDRFGLSIGFRISTPDEPEDRWNMPGRAETAARRRRSEVLPMCPVRCGVHPVGETRN
jgi:hypothetical protein